MQARPLIPALLLAAIACGPPGLVGEPPGDATTSSSTGTPGESSESGEPTETETETETGAPTTDGASFGFVPEYDGQPEPCDSFAQDCPEGEKCVPYSTTGSNWDSNKCVPVLGDQAVGEPCTYTNTADALDDCDASSHCWDVALVDGEPVGTCHAFCTGTADNPQCPTGSACLISGSGDISLCIPTCDPLVQDCNEGLACFWDGNGFNCIFTTEDIPLGEPCGYINDCAGGLICVDATALPACGDSACCTAFCELEQPDPCDAQLPGTACLAFFEEGTAPPGYEEVGLCVGP